MKKLVFAILAVMSFNTAFAGCNREVLLTADALTVKVILTDSQSAEIQTDNSDFIVRTFGKNNGKDNCKKMLKKMLDRDLQISIEGQPIDLELIYKIPAKAN